MFTPINKGPRIKDAVPALFDRTLLRDEMAVEAAIRALDRHLVDPATNKMQAIAELVEVESVPHAIEFVLSTANEEVYSLIRAALLQDFPITPNHFISSVSSQLCTRFALFFLFIPSDTASASLETSFVRAAMRETESAIAILKVLAHLQFEDECEEPLDDGLDEYADMGVLVKRKGYNKKKQKKKKGPRTSPIDTTPITKAGYIAPQTKREAADLTASILLSQKELLETYLDELRAVGVVAMLKRFYFPAPVEVVDVSTSEPLTIETSNITEEVPDDLVTLPPVLPMKAALYFDSADGFGEWRILISTRADRDLRQARRRDAKTFSIFVKKIKELSKGHFSDDNQKRLTGLDVEIPIYEAKMTGDTRLVYQVDCVPEFESTIERQVIRIFGIYTHAQLDRRFWDCMSRQLGRRGAEYRKRCTYRNPPVIRGDNVFAPASWPPPAESAPLEPAAGASDMRKEDLEELHSLLVLEKFVTFSQALLNSILADQDVVHVFDVTPQEKKIIEHPSSCYVLGRSGTGKTTTMLFKMLGIERAWESHRDAMAKPRQLFVTQSRVLAEKVEEFFAKLLDSLSTASQSPSELADMASRKKVQQEQGLVDRDEEIYWRGDLPQRYGALKDEHFPMFLTYDHVCRLLESEFHHNEAKAQEVDTAAQSLQEAFALEDPISRDGQSNDYMQRRRTKFVSFGTFLEEYWSHFPQSLTKGLDPTLVFGEFMGVIKGSELALERPEGFLDVNTYYGLSHRTQGTFANQRESIYKLFKAYLKRKKERGDYDAADRTHSLINSLRSTGVPGQDIDFIYVDEAQDNLLIDALVLRTLCRNPHGMFWAGDTAQTISVGSAFRFNDLKSFLYRFEETNVGFKPERRAQPESFHLAVNYRSHAGIVNCAHSVIQLITEFWPHAIDALAEERGLIDGLKPVFFSGWDQNTVRYEQFLFGESGSHIEFGAEQCILVRDDEAREKLRAQVGDIGLIMTLYESKGLEFNDVLLYNFFEDSTADLSQWRVVLNALPPQYRADHPAPRFDDARHSGVCRELKFLYVAITRARKNLWIADGSEKGEPMRIVWTHKNQIQNCTPGTDVPRLAMSSTAEDWGKTALTLFNNRRYMQAMHCYERAGLPREKAVAHAYYLREVARSTPVPRGDTTAQALAFGIAAQAFLTSAQDAITEKRAYYRIAGECYVQSGDDHKAAQAYSLAMEYTLAAQHFRKAGKFEEAVNIIKSHKGEVVASVAENIVDVSRLYFLREKQIKKARDLFENDDDALEYMEDYGLDIAKASFLEGIGRFAEAAELLFMEGNTLEAIRLLTLDKSNETSMQRAIQYLLDGLWKLLPCGTSVSDDFLRMNGNVAKLLQLADTLEGAVVESDMFREVAMFRAIVSRDMSALLALSREFLASGNAPATFLCLDHIFSMPLKLQAASLTNIATALETFLAYAQRLRALGSHRNPCDVDVVQKLFALQQSTEDSFLVPQSSFLVSQCVGRFAGAIRSSAAEGALISRGDLDRLLKHVLKKRLVDRVREENRTCRSLQPLHPCLPFTAFRSCNRVNCPRNHIDLAGYDAAEYNTRVRVYILQILIYQTISHAEISQDIFRERRDWTCGLSEALFPDYYKLGSVHILSPGSIPEFEPGLQIVRIWVRDLLYRLDPYQDDCRPFLTLLARTARLAVTFDITGTFEYFPRMRCSAAYRPLDLLRGNDRAYIVHDLLATMQNSDIFALDHGVLFLNHVLDHKVQIDIGLLCDFMDSLCTSLIMASKLHKQNGILHDVTLPRSWISRAVPHLPALRFKQTQLLELYKNNIACLLETIYTGVGAEYLLFDSRRNLTNLPYQLRNIFFTRICKNICLWAYHFRVFQWRNDVTRAITSVRQPGRTFHASVNGYVTAKTWDDLAKLVRNSSRDTPLDEMVQLHHGSFPVPRSPLRNVRRVVYNRAEDIPFLLKTDASSVASVALRAEALPFVPTPAALEQTQPVNEESAEEAPPEDEHSDDGHDDELNPVNLESVTQAIDAERSKAAPAPPSPEEFAAAKKVATAYLRYLGRTRSQKNSTLEMRRRKFSAFENESKTMEWPNRHYRLLFLGPIPHLYITIEDVKNHLHDARTKAKKRFNIVQHLELENVKTALTELNRLWKLARRLQEAVAPAADVHKKRDIDQLKAYTLEVQDLLRSLPSAQTLAWEEDMKIALKGIVEPKKLPSKPPKPDLNVEDVDEQYDL